MKPANVVWQSGNISLRDRESLLKQKGVCLWFTGLSGSGKSTLARGVEQALYERGRLAYVLDGDNIRHGLNADMGFSEEDRKENIRRIAEVSKLFADAGIITLTAFISPFRADRDAARSIMEKGRFIEIYVKCALDICEKRDVKGLYSKARKNEIQSFTGISSPYEEPRSAEIVLDTAQITEAVCVERILTYMKEKQIIGKI